MATRAKPQRRVRLVHWNAAEALERAKRLSAAGYRVDAAPITPQSLKQLRAQPPDAVVIDLTRLPMQGRDVALAVRQAKPTRALPVVFVDGDPAKVAKIRTQVDGAVFTSWNRIRGALRDAIAHPPVDAKAPGSLLAGYSGTPLPKKLGVKPGSLVRLVGAPEGFEAVLGELPEGVRVQREARVARASGSRNAQSMESGPPTITLWFVRNLAALERGVAAAVPASEGGGLWIVWPKKTSPLASDVSETEVRRAGLAAGMVDFKVCAVDATWSGLRFSRRTARRH